MYEFNRRSLLINHRQSSIAFVCFLSGENNLAFGVHRPMLPPSIEIVRKLEELTEQYLFIIFCGYCQHSRKCHKKSEAIAQILVFYKKKKTRGWVPETRHVARPFLIRGIVSALKLSFLGLFRVEKEESSGQQ